MSEPRRLDAEATARYLCVRPDSLARLAKAGREALDAAFDGGTAAMNVRTAVEDLAQKLATEGRPRRQKHTR